MTASTRPRLSFEEYCQIERESSIRPRRNASVQFQRHFLEKPFRARIEIMDDIPETANLEQRRLLRRELATQILGLLSQAREPRQLTPN
jgi:hypothetical protein